MYIVRVGVKVSSAAVRLRRVRLGCVKNKSCLSHLWMLMDACGCWGGGGWSSVVEGGKGAA